MILLFSMSIAQIHTNYYVSDTFLSKDFWGVVSEVGEPDGGDDDPPSGDGNNTIIPGIYNDSWSNLGYQMRNLDRSLSGQYKTGKNAQAPAFIKLLNSFNPILALTDAGYKIFNGTDMYGEDVSSANRYIGSATTVLFMIPGVGAYVKIADETLFILGPIINEAAK